MTRKNFYRDNRGIAELPVRLFVAMVVGVMALTVMTGILSGLPTLEQTELTYEVDDGDAALVDGIRGGAESIRLNVVTQTGKSVEGATLVIEGKNVALENGPEVVSTGADSSSRNVNIADDDAGVSAEVTTDLREDQSQAELKVSIKPPSDSNYVDNQANPTLTVVS